jgi:uncharacterized protein YcgI (DUF1989 family)
MSMHLGYSEPDLIDDLQAWWDSQVADNHDPFAIPSPSRTGTIFEVVVAVDSLCVVSALAKIAKHVTIPVPPRIIKPGGYCSCEEMISDLLPKIRALAIKQPKKEAA